MAIHRVSASTYSKIRDNNLLWNMLCDVDTRNADQDGDKLMCFSRHMSAMMKQRFDIDSEYVMDKFPDTTTLGEQ